MYPALDIMRRKGYRHSLELHRDWSQVHLVISDDEEAIVKFPNPFVHHTRSGYHFHQESKESFIF